MMWLDDKDSVTQKDLEESSTTATIEDDTYGFAYTYSCACATHSAADNDDNAESWVNEYFKQSGDNKQDYIDEIEKVIKV